jgi:hypothetical protein
MEETLLSASPMKGKKRDIILFKIGTVLRTFDEGKDGNHISLLAALTFGGPLLISLMPTAYDLTFKSEDLTVLRRNFAASCTPAGT